MECCHTTIKTDHRPQIHVKTQPYLSSYQIRWTQKLGRYNFTVKYKKGITNIAADALSRHPDLQGNKYKFVHFSDQRGFPLVQQHVFSETDAVVPNFERSVWPACAYIRTNTESMINKDNTVRVP